MQHPQRRPLKTLHLQHLRQRRPLETLRLQRLRQRRHLEALRQQRRPQQLSHQDQPQQLLHPCRRQHLLPHLALLPIALASTLSHRPRAVYRMPSGELGLGAKLHPPPLIMPS